MLWFGKGKVILHLALLSVCLVDVTLKFYKPHIICFGCSKESSQLDSSFKDPQHGLWIRKMKNDFTLHTLIMRSG